jgi:cytochrome c
MVVRALLAGLPALVLMTGTATAQTAAAGDAAAGEKVFNQCKACHTVEAGKNRIGPSLHGVVGREAGKVEGFKYSQPMKDSGMTWTPENLDKYLADPKATIPGNKMAFAGLKSPQDRANVIAYLSQQK